MLIRAFEADLHDTMKNSLISQVYLSQERSHTWTKQQEIDQSL